MVIRCICIVYLNLEMITLRFYSFRHTQKQQILLLLRLAYKYELAKVYVVASSLSLLLAI